MRLLDTHFVLAATHAVIFLGKGLTKKDLQCSIATSLSPAAEETTRMVLPQEKGVGNRGIADYDEAASCPS